MTSQIQIKIRQLEELDAQAEITRLDKQKALSRVIPAEVKAKMETIELEFGQQLEAIRETIAKLESEVKLAVLNHGETVKGDRYKAVYGKGRVSWNSKGLAGYMVAHPEIEAFRSEGSPTVSIRRG